MTMTLPSTPPSPFWRVEGNQSIEFPSEFKQRLKDFLEAQKQREGSWFDSFRGIYEFYKNPHGTEGDNSLLSTEEVNNIRKKLGGPKEEIGTLENILESKWGGLYVEPREKKDRIVKYIREGDLRSLMIIRLYINNGLEYYSERRIGRFYLNIEPEAILIFLDKLVTEALIEDLHIQVKVFVPDTYTTEAFNYRDNIVLYFDAREEKEVLKMIERLYFLKRAKWFRKGTPLFTALIRDSSGEVMEGIGFGEEPRYSSERGKESFGTLRAKILDEVCRKAKKWVYKLVIQSLILTQLLERRV